MALWMSQREKNEETGLFNIVNVHTSMDVKRDSFFTDSSCYIFWVKKKKRIIVIFKNLETAILCLDSHPL